ncbi:hypothetical protein D3C79_744520 [compost metagenome]
MGEHRFSADIADGPDVEHAGLALVVDGNRRTVHLQRQAFQVEALGARLAPDRDQYLVSAQLQQFTLRITYLQRLLVGIETFDAVLEVELDPQLLDRLGHRCSQFTVVGWQDALAGFDHADLDAKLAVGDAQLQADVAAANHGQVLGQGFRRQGLGGGNDRATQRQHRQFDAA